MFYAYRYMRAASRLGIEFAEVDENTLLEYGLSNKKFGLNPTESAVSAYRLFMPDAIKRNPFAGENIVSTTAPLIMVWVQQRKVLTKIDRQFGSLRSSVIVGVAVSSVGRES